MTDLSILTHLSFSILTHLTNLFASPETKYMYGGRARVCLTDRPLSNLPNKAYVSCVLCLMSLPSPRHFSVFASPAYLPDVCGSLRLESYAPPSSARHASLQLLNWTHWPLDCSYKSIEGTPLCYHVDPDVHNDAEPWQEIERVMFERWLALPQNCYRDGLPCEIRAAVIVVPSLIAHCAAYDGVHLDGWKPGMIEGRIDAHRRYWNALRLRDEMRSRQRSALGSKRRHRPQLLLMQMAR